MRLDDMHICKAYKEAIETHLLKLELNQLGYSQNEINQVLTEAGLEGLKKFAKGALKKTIPAVAMGAAALTPSKGQAQDFSKFGWREGSGQPTATVMGGLMGLGAGSQIAKRISKGSDAPWIGAATGLAAGGLMANYLSGPKGQPKQQEPVKKSEPEKKSYGTGTGEESGSSGKEEGKPTGPSKLDTNYDKLTTVPSDSKEEGGPEIRSAKKALPEKSMGTLDKNWIKSPYSDFMLSKFSPGIKSGDVMRDPLVGKNFVLPAF